MKILVLGPVASGKTTIAKKIQEETNLPLFDIDSIVHNDASKDKRTEEEQRKMINQILKENKEWIVEGMPRTHLEVLASSATTIIYLDREKSILKRRLLQRHLKIHLNLEKANYEVNRKLYKRMLEYINNDQKEILKECMKKYPSKLVILKTDNDYQTFIDALKEGEILKYQ